MANRISELTAAGALGANDVLWLQQGTNQRKLTIATLDNRWALKSEIPTNNNQLTNGSNYATTSQLFSGAYGDLSGLPDLSVYALKTDLFSGAYGDLSGKPDLSLYALKTSLFSGAYDDLSGRPSIPTNNTQLSNGRGYITGRNGPYFSPEMSVESGAYRYRFAPDSSSLKFYYYENGAYTKYLGYFGKTGDWTVNGSLTEASDERLKTDVETLSDGLGFIRSLRGVRYTKDGRKEIGLIAQEVRNVLPEIVRGVEAEDGYLSVSYGRVVSPLVEAVKELAARVETLESAITSA